MGPEHVAVRTPVDVERQNGVVAFGELEGDRAHDQRGSVRTERRRRRKRASHTGRPFEEAVAVVVGQGGVGLIGDVEHGIARPGLSVDLRRSVDDDEPGAVRGRLDVLDLAAAELTERAPRRDAGEGEVEGGDGGPGARVDLGDIADGYPVDRAEHAAGEEPTVARHVDGVHRGISVGPERRVDDAGEHVDAGELAMAEPVDRVEAAADEDVLTVGIGVEGEHFLVEHGVERIDQRSGRSVERGEESAGDDRSVQAPDLVEVAADDHDVADPRRREDLAVPLVAVLEPLLAVEVGGRTEDPGPTTRRSLEHERAVHTTVGTGIGARRHSIAAVADHQRADAGQGDPGQNGDDSRSGQTHTHQHSARFRRNYMSRSATAGTGRDGLRRVRRNGDGATALGDGPISRGGRARRRSGDLPLFRRSLCQLSYPTVTRCEFEPEALMRSYSLRVRARGSHAQTFAASSSQRLSCADFCAVPTRFELATSALTGRRELLTSPRDLVHFCTAFPSGNTETIRYRHPPDNPQSPAPSPGSEMSQSGEPARGTGTLTSAPVGPVTM